MEQISDRLFYIENVLKRLIDVLKQKNILDQDFLFLTEEERNTEIEQKIADFIQNYR